MLGDIFVPFYMPFGDIFVPFLIGGITNMKTIVFDFDGVIHKGYDGYKDGSIYGEIDFEILDYIKELLKTHYVVISSNRLDSQILKHMVSLDTGIKFEVMPYVVPAFWSKKNVVGITNMKAVGIAYIDDRAVRYENNLDVIKQKIKYISEEENRK